ncbi:hypothetical protein [Lactobacillus sp.]|uniref:hypothetical protein n=1 Tax=Lactobacillus sp. TaxID=1591 RepID=UPI0025F38973|nr:hypothetical protein [Lactobacillus sp.]MCO6531423.1 hypothetical protein [Lactobacillus sp.]
MRLVQKIMEILAIVLWILVIGTFAVAIVKHQLWSMGPIITYNRPRNFLGWMIVGAIASTAASAVLKLVQGK